MAFALTAPVCGDSRLGATVPQKVVLRKVAPMSWSPVVCCPCSKTVLAQNVSLQNVSRQNVVYRLMRDTITRSSGIQSVFREQLHFELSSGTCGRFP
ncbi:hypothetical protein L596_011051 [Steinernema carpocapsae]|uniref:Uncharacterized protein n=1 Tax=Steinernema carpocapsae TaxID=34508 RepID=A0A4U5NTG7_STECR|nr:hypothetical protein L596_011051 [Steinernema carpocapsae]